MSKPVTKKSLYGEIEFNVFNHKTGNGFVFRIQPFTNASGETVHFVRYLAYGDWNYLGIFDITYSGNDFSKLIRLTSKSDTFGNADAARTAFCWVVGRILFGVELPECVTTHIYKGESLPDDPTPAQNVEVVDRGWERVTAKPNPNFGAGIPAEPKKPRKPRRAKTTAPQLVHDESSYLRRVNDITMALYV